MRSVGAKSTEAADDLRVRRLYTLSSPWIYSARGNNNSCSDFWWKVKERRQWNLVFYHSHVKELRIKRPEALGFGLYEAGPRSAVRPFGFLPSPPHHSSPCKRRSGISLHACTSRAGLGDPPPAEAAEKALKQNRVISSGCCPPPAAQPRLGWQRLAFSDTRLEKNSISSE